MKIAIDNPRPLLSRFLISKESIPTGILTLDRNGRNRP